MTHRISIALTPQQQDQIKAVVGVPARTIELSVEELEDRIAPSRILRDPMDIGLADVEGGALAAHEPVDLDGVGERLDGEYHVSEADHTIDSGSKGTSVDLERSE